MNTGNDVLIREAMASDAAELARLRWESRVEDQSGHSRDEFLRECSVWVREALASSRWLVAVAESEPHALCGCMFLQFVEKVPVPGAKQREWGYLTNSFVDSPRRNLGIGQKLLRFLLAAAENRGVEFLIVWPSDKALAFYERAGFRPVSDVHAGSEDAPPLELMLSVPVDNEFAARG